MHELIAANLSLQIIKKQHYFLNSKMNNEDNEDNEVKKI